MSCRRVRFTRGESAGSVEVSIVVHDTEPMTDEEFSSYFVLSDDETRFNKDIEDTIRKYVDHRFGRGSFDHDSYTIRGLEEVIDHLKCNTKYGKKRDSRADIKAQHKHEVLEEVRRQQMAGKSTLLDADQIRQISLRLSEANASRAALTAVRDAEEVCRIHHPESSSGCSEDQLLATNEDCQRPQISAKPAVLSSGNSNESNCSTEKNKSGRRDGRWLLSFTRRKKIPSSLAVE